MSLARPRERRTNPFSVCCLMLTGLSLPQKKAEHFRLRFFMWSAWLMLWPCRKLTTEENKAKGMALDQQWCPCTLQGRIQSGDVHTVLGFTWDDYSVIIRVWVSPLCNSQGTISIGIPHHIGNYEHKAVSYDSEPRVYAHTGSQFILISLVWSQ
jgi:hypothetical protein